MPAYSYTESKDDGVESHPLMGLESHSSSRSGRASTRSGSGSKILARIAYTIGGFVGYFIITSLILKYHPSFFDLTWISPSSEPVQIYQTPSKPSSFSGSQPLDECPSPRPLRASPPAPINLWASLTLAETTFVQSYLENSSIGGIDFNLTRPKKAQLSDNSIFGIEIYYPPKEQALAYLDGNGKTPERYARVTMHHGSGISAEVAGKVEGIQESKEPIIVDYLLGPLPELEDDKFAKATKGMSIRKLSEIYHRLDIPYNARGISWYAEIEQLFRTIEEDYVEALQVRLFFPSFPCSPFPSLPIIPYAHLFRVAIH
jgi:hypothetical protein